MLLFDGTDRLSLGSTLSPCSTLSWRREDVISSLPPSFVPSLVELLSVVLRLSATDLSLVLTQAPTSVRLGRAEESGARGKVMYAPGTCPVNA